MLAALLLAATLVSQYGTTWQALGSRVVTRNADHDTIMVVWAEGTFHAVKLTVRGSPIRIHRVIVHFEKGEPLELALHGLVPDGGESRTLHVKGAPRAIRSVDVWYDPNSVSHTGAVVELDGRD